MWDWAKVKRIDIGSHYAMDTMIWKRIWGLGFALALCFVLSTCNDPNAWDCLKSAGEWRQEQRTIPSGVNAVHTTDGVNVRLIQSLAIDEYAVEGGANLLEKVKVSGIGPTLELRNENGCNLARATPDQLLVRLPMGQRKWRFFDLAGYGLLTNEDTLRGDTIRVNQYGAGKVDLKVKTNWMVLDLNGNGDFDLSGRTKYLQIFTALFNRFDATACAAETVYVYARGEHDITVRADKMLYVSMEGTGDVNYVGNPELIVEQKGGRGQVRPR